MLPEADRDQHQQGPREAATTSRSARLQCRRGDHRARQSKCKAAVAFRSLPQILHQHEQMERVARRCDELEALIVAPPVIFRVHGEGADSCDVGCLQRPAHGILSRPATPLPCHGALTARRASSMIGTGCRAQTVCQALRRVGIFDLPDARSS